MARNRDPDLNPALSVKDAGIRNLAKVAALPQVPGSGPVAAPKGKAKRATANNLAEFEKRRHELEAAQNAALAAAQAKGAKLEGMALTVRQKAGVDGRLFGSVTNIDIVDALIAQGHEVERAMVRLPQGPLKMIGEYDISVALHSDVVVQIKVTVQGESAQ